MLTDLSRYVYGTTRLGDEKIPFDERVGVARAAIDAGVWMHTSDQYGQALQVLKAAFDQDRSNVPPLIFKIGWESVEQVREQILRQLEAVGLEKMAIGQLCPGGGLAEEVRKGGASIELLNALKEEGLVGRYVLETWPWTSSVPLDALRAGHLHQLVEGLIFYLNPLQRFVTNELWDQVQTGNVDIVAMRTVGGGDVYRIRDHGPEYLRSRATEVAPLFEQSGCRTWTEFCVRFVYGVPQVCTTVGATGRKENLAEFLSSTRDPQPLPEPIQQVLLKLQRRWSDEHDRHAEPWSM
ncbi:MAG TPA: hypothetical protein VGE01_14220 [Fimbriimonas sp.]